eukprot:1149426-Rhodomonas_salina.1
MGGLSPPRRRITDPRVGLSAEGGGSQPPEEADYRPLSRAQCRGQGVSAPQGGGLPTPEWGSVLRAGGLSPQRRLITNPRAELSAEGWGSQPPEEEDYRPQSEAQCRGWGVTADGGADGEE